MRTIPWLAGCITTSLFCSVNANVEKVIFLAPSPESIPNAPVSLADLRVRSLYPPAHTLISTRLAPAFPTDTAPHGLESWYLLRRLEAGRRYEVRICWPATQPTDFWLNTYTLNHVFETPDLVASLAINELGDKLSWASAGYLPESNSAAPESLLLLRIQSAASFYSSNRTLMSNPPLVDVDIILDPFILNVLPQSLGLPALYIAIVAIGAWILSGVVYRWLLSIAQDSSKPHTE
jgi:hypothetical protein